ncbi:hypothetical protein BIU88_01955 [Chlorobaculum limnaeum]|uniref:Porin n=1 Tax=Chlorobaculum limnaeum TaxID=274537 RepID=A0A1D8D0S0_CHLLM|nr:hypothetical protein [Chlorobaculum limnaeum]AOS83015.1 hypothetical protein BIU88_01955 [Chlorobaculum limnaeum]
MKKMLSLAAMFAVLAYASPASAELKLSGDAGVRLRDVSYFGDADQMTAREADDDLLFQYRVRLNAAADLGEGYFFKAMITNETLAGGWTTSNNGLNEFDLTVSNFYFGRMQENCHWAVGRLPLNSLNNPIFDLTLYPAQPLESPVAFLNMDRVLGANYGVKLGDGMLNATLCALDNDFNDDTNAEGDGLLNDGYAFLLNYKVNVGDITIEPQILTVLTNANLFTQDIMGYPGLFAGKVTPYTFGALVGVPAGDAKLSFGAFYTACDDTTPNTNIKVDYSGYLFRVKGEIGNFMAWYDFNRTNDDAKDVDYTNHFVWAQYKIPVYSSAAGSVTIQPTLRYLASKIDDGSSDVTGSRLRSELWATVTF